MVCGMKHGVLDSGVQDLPVWAHGIFAVPCSTMTPEVAATSFAPSWVPCSGGPQCCPPSGVPPSWAPATSSLWGWGSHPVSVWHSAWMVPGKSRQWCCLEQRGSRGLCVLGVWETGDGLQGQQIRLGRAGHFLPGFIMFLEWSLLFLFESK